MQNVCLGLNISDIRQNSCSVKGLKMSTDTTKHASWFDDGFKNTVAI